MYRLPKRLCGGYVYLGRYIKCSTFTFTFTFGGLGLVVSITTATDKQADSIIAMLP